MAAALPQSAAQEELESAAKRLIQEQMRSRKLSYAELSERLASLGFVETPARLNRKVNRKKFQASFFIACLLALDVETLDISGVDVSAAGRRQRLAREQFARADREARRRRPLNPKAGALSEL
ncbi:DUF6471 domain-containing protein [Rubrivivax gelatinosus]|uniref:DUF6471 domain-containing protein n=1 Tax=Rubrivivax gelatinosus (strain NBRC 100245 / IL144) TaxID=983917 RepID=I0HQ34_RUBGI|nr:DUF6471 domain-containing protein [Rubrivivax gelatinosus]BAL95121.1 hypothetical protein RGE_17800 [Rubrivivax gelatinosus IL144]